jgi:hypothetical protein
MSNSLFISHVFENISMEFVSEILTNNGFGVVDRIEYVQKTSSSLGHTFNSCFVFFSEIDDTESSILLRENLSCSRATRLYYENSIYWNLFPNTSEIRHFKENVHMDLETVVPVDTSISCLMSVFQDMNLGSIHSIELIPTEYFDEDYGEVSYANNMLVRIHFDYWYRTIEAVEFQSNILINPQTNHLSMTIENNDIWKLFISREKPLILPGNNPFIWLNCINASSIDNTERNVFESDDDESRITDETEDLMSELDLSKEDQNKIFIDDMLKRHMDDYCSIVSIHAKTGKTQFDDLIQFGYDASALEMLDQLNPKLRISTRMPPCMFNVDPLIIIKIR